VWRVIAEANDIDDPMRLKPGRDLLLPAPEEIER
jgi:nucleoid-associated protein YgaU